jgi:predicted AlkP superfamily phosphohydrolase/phosphomutase
VLGLDGLDPRYLARLMSQGKLPNMSRLRELGGFRPLATTAPPQSPVAWATFITGLDPGGHGIYDFIQRDPETYLPYFSLASSKPAGRALTIGKWRFPLSRGKIELLRAGRAFWELLNERGLPASIYQVPSNYPPRDTGAKQLAGLGAPDLRGSYGEFSYYTEAPFAGEREVSGGRVYRVSTSRGRGKARLLGPENTLREGEPDCQIDFEIWLDRGHRVAEIGLQGRQILLREREWSDWIPLRFQMLPGLKHVSGICRFYLKEVSPHLKLYVTPVNADPLDPDLPVSAPAGFARELAQRFGRFYTQGFPHDVKALRQGVLDDDEYLQQSDLAQGEARRMYESALGEFRRGLLFHYFATSDRTQHVFWRTMDPRHPAYEAKAARRHGGAIEECYRASDELVGLALESAGADTTLIVLSDHGFLPYYRSFNLNAWLAEKGYLAGLGAWGPGADIFSNANWQETVAYGLGFNAIYLNLRGREARGCVLPEDRHKLARGLAADLRRMRDPETGERVIENVHLAEDVYSAFEAARAPDLVVGYAAGYRCSEASVLGEAGGPVLEDNADKWSGDHCMDSSLVPGVLLANKPIRAESPALPDVTASVLAEFGVRVPAELAGRPVW